MIKIGVQTGGATRDGIDSAYRVIKETGFDAVDANLDYLVGPVEIRNGSIPAALCGDTIDLEIFRPWKDGAEKYGLENYQAHAPFPSNMQGQPELNERIIKMLKNMIRGCDHMGCRNLVIHPLYQLYADRTSPEDEWEQNIEGFSRLIPEAKEYGVTLCLENMFTANRGKAYASCCSDPETACRYIDTLNGLAGQECFGFCLDTGHLLLVGGDVRQMMKRLGHRIRAFHIHDNNGSEDQHLAPFMGVQDWNRFTEGLAACGFDGTISFETFRVWDVVDPEMIPSMMRFIAETGRMFARRAEAMRG